MEPAKAATKLAGFHHHELDIRNREAVIALIDAVKPDAIVHTAAQPSHDRAAAIPFDDFDTNAVRHPEFAGSTRGYSTSIPFVHMSTNKVYGDAPNRISDERTGYALGL